jgi:cytochrome c oxidase accessory protein FixG
MANLPCHRLGPWRRSIQWSTSLVLLALPFVRIDGASLLRLDIPSLSLQFFGTTLHIEELYLFLLLAFCLLLLFLLVTLVFGRAWCGWACPQTTLSDLSEGLARRLGLKLEGGRFHGSLSRRLLLQVLLALLSLLVGANLVWYFLSPYQFFSRLFAADLPAGVLVPWLGMALVVYLDMVWLRRLLCREFCPYGRFQTVLVDPGTLTLRFHPAHADRCIRCGACVRACPMGIDIRRGFQVECIDCGRCLDACREAMARRGEGGIIRYTFGLEGQGIAALLNPRLLLLGSAFLVLLGVLVFATINRPRATLKLSRSATAAPRLLADGRVATFFFAVIANRTTREQVLTLSATDSEGHSLPLSGPVAGLRLQENERRRVDFLLLTPVSGEPRNVDFSLRDRQGVLLAESRAILLPLPRSFP